MPAQKSLFAGESPQGGATGAGALRSLARSFDPSALRVSLAVATAAESAWLTAADMGADKPRGAQTSSAGRTNNRDKEDAMRDDILNK